MLFTTTTQWVVLVVLFVAGWLLGLASHPGGRKWKDRYLAERDAHAAVRRDHDTRIADADRRHADAERRHAELERENARLAQATPVTTPIAPVAPRAASAARPAYVDRTPGERRGWFDWSTRRS